jgi:hypothetical protein
MTNDKCPMYVDYVRECANTMGNISREINTTVEFCMSKNYINCPFFIFIHKPEIYCKYFITCPCCQYFKNKYFDEFIKMSKAWCLNNDFTNCSRYKIREAGNIPPYNLLPDGNKLEE